MWRLFAKSGARPLLIGEFDPLADTGPRRTSAAPLVHAPHDPFLQPPLSGVNHVSNQTAGAFFNSLLATAKPDIIRRTDNRIRQAP